MYNETIRDLLQPSIDLPLREDAGKGMVVVGLTVHKPKVHLVESRFKCIALVILCCSVFLV